MAAAALEQMAPDVHPAGLAVLWGRRRLDEPELDRLFRQTLGQLALVSDGATCRFEPGSPTRRMADSAPPTGATLGARRGFVSDSDQLDSRYRAAETLDDKRVVARAAVRVLDRARKAPDPPAAYEARGTLRREREIANAPGSLRAVAEMYGISHEQVRRLRQKHGA